MAKDALHIERTTSVGTGGDGVASITLVGSRRVLEAATVECRSPLVEVSLTKPEPHALYDEVWAADVLGQRGRDDSGENFLVAQVQVQIHQEQAETLTMVLPARTHRGVDRAPTLHRNLGLLSEGEIVTVHLDEWLGPGGLNTQATWESANPLLPITLVADEEFGRDGALASVTVKIGPGEESLRKGEFRLADNNTGETTHTLKLTALAPPHQPEVRVNVPELLAPPSGKSAPSR